MYNCAGVCGQANVDELYHDNAKWPRRELTDDANRLTNSLSVAAPSSPFTDILSTSQLISVCRPFWPADRKVLKSGEKEPALTIWPK